MKKAIKSETAAEMIKDGSTVMIGGFMGVGTPTRVIEAIVARGTKGLTIIANDTAMPDVGIGKLIAGKAVRKVVASHIGLNPQTQEMMMSGEIEVELIPQGTLVEQIRAAGVGLGGVLTPTGLGTAVAEGKEIATVDGQEYLLERAIAADFALISAKNCDYVGNLEYSLTAHNFNPVMAMAGKTVIAEPEHILPVGAIPPDSVKTPGILVDYILERPRK